MRTNDERFQELMSYLDSLAYIKPEKIPAIDLYMDQVTTFMNEYLGHMKRYPDDKVLTKTMINNYAKNNLLPPPVKKKYSKEHMLMLIFIYYYKNLLSFNDIEEIFKPITANHFSGDSSLSLADIYKEIFSLEKSQMERLKEDISVKYNLAMETFSDYDGEDDQYLKLFSFICQLAFDVYLKKQMIERLTDQLREDFPDSGKK